jgi:RNA recognition motif-containing protein
MPAKATTVTRYLSGRQIGSDREGKRLVSVNIYVGNLPFSVNNAELENLFSEHGTVSSAQVIMDRETGRSRGFGFVEMEGADTARAAIEALDGADVDGRRLKVNEARERQGRR